MIRAKEPTGLAFIYNRVLRMSSLWIVSTSQDTPQFLRNWSGPQLNVTIPTWYIAASLKSLQSKMIPNFGKVFARNGTATFEPAYPVVNTICKTAHLMGLTPNMGLPFFEVDGSFSSNITMLGDLANNASRFIASDSARRYYAPVWFPSPDPRSTSMVGIFLYQYLDSPDSQPLSRII